MPKSTLEDQKCTCRAFGSIRPFDVVEVGGSNETFMASWEDPRASILLGHFAKRSSLVSPKNSRFIIVNWAGFQTWLGCEGIPSAGFRVRNSALLIALSVPYSIRKVPKLQCNISA
jgi:hypothetical protein